MLESLAALGGILGMIAPLILPGVILRLRDIRREREQQNL